MYLFGQVDGEAGVGFIDIWPLGITFVVHKAQLYQRGFVQYSFLSCTVKLCNSIFDRRVKLAFFPAVLGTVVAAIDPSNWLVYGFTIIFIPRIYLLCRRCGQGDAGAFRSFPLPKAERNVTAVSRIGTEQGAVVDRESAAGEFQYTGYASAVAASERADDCINDPRDDSTFGRFCGGFFLNRQVKGEGVVVLVIRRIDERYGCAGYAFTQSE